MGIYTGSLADDAGTAADAGRATTLGGGTAKLGLVTAGVCRLVPVNIGQMISSQADGLGSGSMYPNGGNATALKRGGCDVVAAGGY